MQFLNQQHNLNPLDYDSSVQAEYNDYLSKIEKPLTDKDLVLMQHQYLKDLPDSEFDNLDNFSQTEFSFYELRPAERDLVINNWLEILKENTYIDESHALDYLYATYLRNPHLIATYHLEDLYHDNAIRFFEMTDRERMRAIDDYLESLEENRFYHGGAYSGDSYDRGDRDKLFVYARHLAHHSIVPNFFNREVTA
ncbi:MAG: hypothetical protein U9Q97_08685 [Acidobacteriota bacterium]|nr:hypothetical protein [Acidobacteriota bacterium]